MGRGRRSRRAAEGGGDVGYRGGVVAVFVGLDLAAEGFGGVEDSVAGGEVGLVHGTKVEGDGGEAVGAEEEVGGAEARTEIEGRLRNETQWTSLKS